MNLMTLVTFPITTNNMKEAADNANKDLEKALQDGYKITHIAACEVGGNMAVYHVLEKEE